MKQIIGEITVATNLDTRTNTAGERLVRIRVQYKSQNRYYSTHVFTNEKEYEKIEKGKKSPKQEQVQNMFNKFVESVKILDRNDEFSFKKIANAAGKGRSTSIQSLIQNKIDVLKKNNQYGTAKIYKYLLDSFNEFSPKPYPIRSFNTDDAEKFVAFLIKSGNNATTIGIKMRHFSATLNQAIKDGEAKSNPIKEIKYPKATKKRNMKISDESLSKLINATTDQISDKEYHLLQYWKAVYFGAGMNIGDLLRLEWKNITDKEIVFKRHKTMNSLDEDIHIPLTPRLKEVIGCISQKQRKNRKRDLICPDLAGYAPNSEEEFIAINKFDNKINLALKNICKKLDIKEKVVIYTARHMYATTLIRKRVPIEYVSTTMGHSNIKTTMRYYFDGFNTEEAMEFAKNLDV